MKTFAAALTAIGVLIAGAGDAAAGSRVIVSTTLNSTLQFFDADDLGELQPPLPSRGGGPVRLWVGEVDGTRYLFTANHGLVGSSVGVFDLSGDLVIEAPLSPAPAPAGFGAVGIAGGTMRISASRHVPMVFLGNTYFALAPCSLNPPPGSVTGFDASLVAFGGLLTPVGTVEIAGALAWGVSVDEAGSNVFGVSNCGDAIDTISVHEDDLGLLAMSNVDSRSTGDGPDGTMFDAASGFAYTVNIGGDSVSVHDRTSPAPLTTVSLKGNSNGRIGPIDATFAEAFDKRWFVTSNGQNDTFGLVDRDLVEACIAGGRTSCPEAHVGNLPTNEPKGAPEGVAFDPVSNRMFVVNKPVGSPSLSVIELEGIVADQGAPAGYTVSTSHPGKIPLTVAGQGTVLPALIAFDVVVDPR